MSPVVTTSLSKSVIEDENKHLHQAEPRVHAADWHSWAACHSPQNAAKHSLQPHKGGNAYVKAPRTAPDRPAWSRLVFLYRRHIR